MSRFDPKPGAPYARCSTCGLVAETKEQIAEHVSSTMAPTGASIGITARSHSYRIENPSRAESIGREVRREADDAIEDAVNNLVERVYQLHEREGVSLDELTAAVKETFVDVDFSEAWSEYIADEIEDDGETQEDQRSEGVMPPMLAGLAWPGDRATAEEQA